MKKLMFAVAAVALASVATAATTKWSVEPTNGLKNGYVKADNPSASTSWIAKDVYVFDAAQVIYGGKTGQQALLLAFNAGEDITSYAVKGMVNGTGDPVAIYASTQASDGKVPSGNQTKFTITGEDAYKAGDVINFFLATTATDGNGDKFIFLSASKEASALDQSQTQTISPALGAGTYYRGNGTEFGDAGWYGAAPEPTSGLLLLIGVGALALRRRRA